MAEPDKKLVEGAQMAVGEMIAAFCSECGSQAEGKFCWNCGKPLKAPRSSSHVPTPHAFPDWSEEFRYEELLKVPEVRTLIERHSVQAVKKVSGEQFLELADVVYKPLMGGLSLTKVAGIIQPLYASWGISTGQTRSQAFRKPVGKMIVSVLCSLARHGQTLKHVEQGSDGCVIQALLPSDIWALAGDLIITVQRDGTGTRIDAATKIGGQLFDWGKSKRCLEDFFRELGGDVL